MSKHLPLLLVSIAAGLVWGFNWFALTWWIMALDGITREATFIGLIYRGFTISPVGSLVGFLWGFVDGFLIGLIQYRAGFSSTRLLSFL